MMRRRCLCEEPREGHSASENSKSKCPGAGRGLLGQEGLSGRVSPGRLLKQSEEEKDSYKMRACELGNVQGCYLLLLNQETAPPHKQNLSCRDMGFGPAAKCSCKFSRQVLGKFACVLSTEMPYLLKER